MLMVKINFKGGLNMAKDKVTEVAELVGKLKELGVEVNAEVSDDAEVKDETKGTVSDDDGEDAGEAETTVVELAATGKGFSIYSDYNSLDSTKFKRLTR